MIGSARPDPSWQSRASVAAAAFDWPQLTAVVEAYIDHLRAIPGAAPLLEYRAILGLLRENQRYDDLLRVADALLAGRVDDPAVTAAAARALVDGGRPATALLLYEAIRADPRTNRRDRAEADGGVGRCCKDLFLTTTDAARRADFLARSYAAYRTAFDREPSNYWLGINTVALLARAAHEDVAVPGRDAAATLPADPAAEAAILARGVLAEVESLAALDPWALATACEARVAVRDHAGALAAADGLVASQQVTAFVLNALLRQLTDVWRLDTTSEPGNQLLPMLRGKLLGLNGGDIVLDSRDVRAERLDDRSSESLERVLGTTRYQGMRWYVTGLERCRAVARIENENGDGIGTGFLVAGPALHPDLPGLVVLTNAHVIPEGLMAQESYLAFHGLDADPASAGRGSARFRVADVLWSRPSTRPGLDTTILQLDGYPAGVTPIPVAERLPRLGGDNLQRAYVIGHPLGTETPQFSLQDNAILDNDETLLHYRSPTEPGSSGSPVLDGRWRLIALHHAGFERAPRLNGKRGSYAANEGILISAIRHGLDQRPPEPPE